MTHEEVRALSDAEPEPQDVEEAWDDYDKWSQRYFYHRKALDGQSAADARRAIEQAIRADERERWAEREQQLVEALRPFAELATCYCDEFWLRDYHRHGPNCFWADYADDIAQARAVLNQERPA